MVQLTSDYSISCIMTENSDICNKTQIILSLFLIVKHTVAIAFKIRVIHLLTKFAADAFVILAALKPAGAVASAAPEPFFYIRNECGVWIKMNFTHFTSLMRA